MGAKTQRRRSRVTQRGETHDGALRCLDLSPFNGSISDLNLDESGSTCFRVTFHGTLCGQLRTCRVHSDLVFLTVLDDVPRVSHLQLLHGRRCCHFRLHLNVFPKGPANSLNVLVPRIVEWVCPCNSQQVSFANETNVEDLKPEDLIPERIDEPVVDVSVPSTGEGIEHVRFRKGSVKQTGDVHGPLAPERFSAKKCGQAVQHPLPQVIGQIPDAFRFLLRTLDQAFERSAKTCLGSTQDCSVNHRGHTSRSRRSTGHRLATEMRLLRWPQRRAAQHLLFGRDRLRKIMRIIPSTHVRPLRPDHGIAHSVTRVWKNQTLGLLNVGDPREPWMLAMSGKRHQHRLNFHSHHRHHLYNKAQHRPPLPFWFS